jgi:hypothetical protein
MIIHEDGSYTYQGVRNVKQLGEKSGKVTAKTMAALDGIVAQADWSNFRTEYGTQAEDSQRNEMIFTRDTLKKKVVYFRMEPQQIKDIESTIDTLIQSDEF